MIRRYLVIAGFLLGTHILESVKSKTFMYSTLASRECDWPGHVFRLVSSTEITSVALRPIFRLISKTCSTELVVHWFDDESSSFIKLIYRWRIVKLAAWVGHQQRRMRARTSRREREVEGSSESRISTYYRLPLTDNHCLDSPALPKSSIIFITGIFKLYFATLTTAYTENTIRASWSHRSFTGSVGVCST